MAIAKDHNVLLLALLEEKEAKQLSGWHAAGLIQVGYTFFTVTVSFLPPSGLDTQIGLNLPASVTSVMSGKVSGESLELCKQNMKTLYSDVYMKMASLGHVPSSDTPVTNESLAENTITAEKIKNTATPPTPKAPKTAKAINTAGPQKLSAATQVGQAVKGTSAASVYYCVGLHEHYAVAARYQKDSDTLSLRLESKVKLAPSMSALLKETGMQESAEYWSMHMALHGVPYGRALGAFLLGSGLQFSDTLTNLSQFKAS